MEINRELDIEDLSLLKMQLGELQIVGRFGYNSKCWEFEDIMKGFRILQNMAEYIAQKIGNLEKILSDNEAEGNLIPEGESHNDDDVSADHDNTSIDQSDNFHMTEEIEEEIEETEFINKNIADSANKHILQCNECQASFVQLKSFKKHECGGSKTKISCPICAKELCKKNIKLHMNLHSNDNKFSSLTKRSILTKHITNEHGNVKHKTDKATICKFCQKVCGRTSGVKKHMQEEHCDLAMHCKVCSNPFFSKRGLRKHMQDHTE